MLLSFKQRHLSISALPDVELPSFTVIVGLNGSGKSHLLEAIANGSISNSIVEIKPGPALANRHIKLLGQDGRVINLEQSYSPERAVDPAATIMGSFEQFRRRLLATPREALEDASNRRISDILKPGEDVWRLGAAEVAARLAETDARWIEEIFAQAEQAFMTPYQSDPQPYNFIPQRMQTHRGMQPEQMRVIAERVAVKLGISPLQVSMSHMNLFTPWGSIDQFSSNLPFLFGKYRDALLQNRLLRLIELEQGDASALSEAEFIAGFGNPPWNDINDTLKAFALPYEVSTPSLYNFDPVSVDLIKLGTGDIGSPANLSTGEKVLLQFALSLFDYDEHFMSVSRPQLLLMDEMDASLHPEMVNRWLRAIREGLVEAQGLHCIVTTHSPTTVALAPESSLFEMKDGRVGLLKISKQEALNRLTFGVPTLSIDYTGRRQVFTESDTDAAIYESVYSLIKSHIECERELNFLSTGLRNKDNGEINAGCTIVKQTVDRLAELGNLSIFGIIDWDGEAISTERIKVVACGERNGIENVLLDPLLIALLMMKERSLPEGLEDIDRFAGASNLGRKELQRLIDVIQMEVFPAATERVEVHYLGGATGDVLREYLEADDHALEDALAEKFPQLNKWKRRGRGELVKAVVKHVLSEHTTLCPVVLPAVFEAVANAPT